jgi:uncharacterized membrane protein YcaP (DUF421 family)
MKPEQIHLNDWQRIFIGDVPGGFYIEVIIRITIIYFVLMLSMRLMGKRMAAQLSRNEMVAMVSLAAAIGVPLQSPDRGILPIIVIAAVVIAVQQLVAKLSGMNQKVEAITQGNVSVLVCDNHLDLRKMELTGITREITFSQLRGKGIRHLGEVKRLYFEAGGSFSLVKNKIEDIVPGLGILPEMDPEFREQAYESSDELVCDNCGLKPKAEDQTPSRCRECGHEGWAFAVS